MSAKVCLISAAFLMVSPFVSIGCLMLAMIASINESKFGVCFWMSAALLIPLILGIIVYACYKIF